MSRKTAQDTGELMKQYKFIKISHNNSHYYVDIHCLDRATDIVAFLLKQIASNSDITEGDVEDSLNLSLLLPDNTVREISFNVSDSWYVVYFNLLSVVRSFYDKHALENEFNFTECHIEVNSGSVHVVFYSSDERSIVEYSNDRAGFNDFMQSLLSVKFTYIVRSRSGYHYFSGTPVQVAARVCSQFKNRSIDVDALCDFLNSGILRNDNLKKYASFAFADADYDERVTIINKTKIDFSAVISRTIADMRAAIIKLEKLQENNNNVTQT